MIERDFDVPFIADLALREKQIQQNYRPIIAVHKWFARRPGTLFRGRKRFTEGMTCTAFALLIHSWAEVRLYSRQIGLAVR